MVSLKKELGAGVASLVVAPDMDSVLDILGSASKDYGKVCYVSFSKPYSSFSDYFKFNKISPSDFFIIDCITKSVIGETKDVENCAFVSSQTAFGEVFDTLRDALQNKKIDILLFDSLSSMLVYEKELFVTRFLHKLVAMTKGLNCKSVFIVLKSDVETDAVENMGMFVDQTINLPEGSE